MSPIKTKIKKTQGWKVKKNQESKIKKTQEWKIKKIKKDQESKIKKTQESNLKRNQELKIEKLLMTVPYSVKVQELRTKTPLRSGSCSKPYGSRAM